MFRFVPLGGLGEIGMNLAVMECQGAALVVDCGVMFPDVDHFGIDVLMPDFHYLEDLDAELAGVVLTHGHEDHIGALPELLQRFDVPVLGTAFTLALVRQKLNERAPGKSYKLSEIAPGDHRDLGPFRLDFARVCHSIPDAVATRIRAGGFTVVHSGDFKFDHTPTDGQPADLSRLARWGDEGVDLLLSDSTNVERPGHSLSEAEVERKLNLIIGAAGARVVLSVFASNIHRIQQVLSASERWGRKVVLAGRSMLQNVALARDIGHLSYAEGTLQPMESFAQLAPHAVTVLATGSQGERRSALSRIAQKEHKDLWVERGDLVILSSRFIPGNELAISKTIDALYRCGAEVIYESVHDVHASGHAYQEEQKLMLALVRPRFFTPVHGDYRHLVKHGQLAEAVGLDPAHVVVVEDGTPVELNREDGHLRAHRGAQVEANRVGIDGEQVLELDGETFRQRKRMARTGAVVALVPLRADRRAAAPSQLVVTGLAGGPRLVRDAGTELDAAVARLASDDLTSSELEEELRLTLRRFFFRELDRKPHIEVRVVVL